jgi:hypothetical protein
MADKRPPKTAKIIQQDKKGKAGGGAVVADCFSCGGSGKIAGKTCIACSGGGKRIQAK